jgi:hypothetical protein
MHESPTWKNNKIFLEQEASVCFSYGMKTFLLSIIFALLASDCFAGNFGPAPFRNGSPLVTGVDGSYQATARSQNVTGVFRFAYSGGIQTENSRQNSWIFFVNGQAIRGSVEAALDDSSLSGTLDSAVSGGTTDSNGNITLPIYIFSGANSGAGSFQGKLNLKSPNGAFSGTGELLPTPPSTNQIVVISQQTSIGNVGNSTFSFAGPITSTNITYTNAGGTMAPVNFKFRGVRTATSTSGAASTSTNSPAK